MYDVGEFRGVQGRAVQAMPQKRKQSAWVKTARESAGKDRRQTKHALELPQLLLKQVHLKKEFGR